jgi:hypothetical protein
MMRSDACLNSPETKEVHHAKEDSSNDWWRGRSNPAHRRDRMGERLKFESESTHVEVRVEWDSKLVIDLQEEGED